MSKTETTSNKRRAFDDLTDKPCMVCLELAACGDIQGRAVMPLPKFPARDDQNRPCCRDCQATRIVQAVGGQPNFSAARLTIANERCEGLTTPLGMMEHFGMCQMGFIEPCSIEDLDGHATWLESVGVPDDTGCVPFEVAR